MASFQHCKMQSSETFLRIGILILTSAVLSATPADAQEEATLKVLQLDHAERADMGRDSLHHWGLDLLEDSYYEVEVRQLGVDVVVRIVDPGGTKRGEFDSPTGEYGTERARWVTERGNGGAWQITIAPFEGSTGLYEIEWISARPATLKDRLVVQADSLRARAVELGAEETEAAISLIEQAVVLLEEALGPDDLDIAPLLDELAFLFQSLADYERAETQLQRSLDISKKALGSENPEISERINNLARLLELMGDYDGAETLYNSALDIRKRRLGPSNVDVARSLNNLGSLYYRMGAYEQAESHFESSREILETIDPRSPELAATLNNLAHVYLIKGDYRRAGPLFEHAHEIRRAIFPPDDPEVANSLQSRALLYRLIGNFGLSETYYKDALKILEAAQPRALPVIAAALNEYAFLYSSMGEYTRAEQLFERSLAIRIEVLGPDHPEVAMSLDNLAGLRLAVGDPDSAVSFLARSVEIHEHLASDVLPALSEKRKRQFLDLISEQTEGIVSLHAEYAMDNPAAEELALETILRRKGRVLDATAVQTATMRERLDPEGRRVFEELRRVQAQSAYLSLRGLGGDDPAVYRRTTTELREEMERLDEELASRSAAFRIERAPVIIGAVKAALEQGTALVEIVQYRPFIAAGDGSWGNPHYAVYVLHPNGEIGSANLGETARIDDAVSNLRLVLASSSSNSSQAIQGLYELVVAPVLSLVGDVHHLLVSPDGALNLVPLAALHDAEGRLLIEDYTITYLTSGRDLLRLDLGPASRTGPKIVADPVYSAPEGAQAVPVVSAVEGEQSKGRGILSGDLSNKVWERLPGTAEEAASLRRILPEAEIRVELEATESYIKFLEAPQILHLATHGFFLPNQSKPEHVGGFPGESSLVRSGLVLVGANNFQGGSGEDGYLTALEVSGLDLWGTELVVLSACETGLGDVTNGEGVYGLRRAIVLAGAESQITSLWDVDDGATRDLMVAYYKRLMSGEGRSEALRQVQLEMFSDPARSHPYYWAGFIPIGDWKPLGE